MDNEKLNVSLLDQKKILEEEIAKLRKDLSCVRSALELCESEKSISLGRVKVATSDLSEMKEMVKSKAELLKSTKEDLEELQGEKALLSSELNALKVGPIGNIQRGNSLFAEVDDKRLQVTEKLESMKNKYTQSKKKLALKDVENEKLKDLVSLANSLKLRQESPQIITVSDKDLTQLQWIHAVVNSARDEANKLRAELDEKSTQSLSDANQLCVIQQDLRKLKARSMKDKALINELKMQMESFKSSQIIIEESSEKDKDGVEAIKENSQHHPKGIRFADDVKKEDTDTRKKCSKRIPKPQSYPKIFISSNSSTPLQVIQEPKENIIDRDMEVDQEDPLTNQDLQNIYEMNKIDALQKTVEEDRKHAKQKILQLQSTIETFSVPVSEENYKAEFDAANDELSLLITEVADLKEMLADANSAVERSKSEKLVVLEQLKELDNELSETKDILKSQNEMIQSTKEALQDLEVEKAFILNEISTLKAGCVNDVNGVNSLFAEVNVKRQSVTDKLEAICNKYSEVKKKLTEKETENEKLKAENACLLRTKQEDDKINEMQLGKLLDSYQTRIDELTKLVHSLELRPEIPQVITVSDDDLSQLHWIDAVVENSRAEARKLRTELQEKSAKRLVETDQLFLLQLELRNRKTQKIRDVALIEELTRELESMNSTKKALAK
ncbi:hypothetical protein AAG570_009149 [Ranatra chinensis]|uniref:Uncharacterized protein n=1 Tax=Ranatra chinensis TaxID=642074 RepID=A0ABD0ZE53_9HEMI